MLVLVAALALLNLVAVLGFLRYLAQRDAADRRERQDLFNRIQAPETALAQVGFEPVSISPFDDEAFIAHQKKVREAADAYQAVIDGA